MGYLVVILGGREYITTGNPDAAPDEVAEALYSVADKVDKLKMPLADGRVLVLPRESVRNATFLACPGMPPTAEQNTTPERSDGR